ncbi:MAG: FixH family protein [Myxococcales bacterium]|nr:FixH family protein [Myxococcales bacterium]
MDETPVGDGKQQGRKGVIFLLAIVFGFLGISVIVHAVALTYVFSTDTDLVRSDYYEAGQNYNAELAQRTAGAKQAFQVAVTAGEAGTVSIQLPKASEDMQAATGRVKLYRPGDASLDQELPLPKVRMAGTTAVWLVQTGKLHTGRWRVRLELDTPSKMAIELDRNVRK